MADERVEIQIHVDGKNAVATLKELEDYINRLNGKSVNIGVNAGGSRGSGGRSGYPGSELSRLGERLWNRELMADQKRIARMEAERTKNYRASYERWWKEQLNEQERRQAAEEAALRRRWEYQEKGQQDRHDIAMMKYENQQRGEQKQAEILYGLYAGNAARAQQIFGAIGNVLSGAGAASNYTSAFASGIGQTFSGMGSMFNFDTTAIARRYITRLATRAVLGNLDASISRADIMNTFVPYMALAGVDQSTAKNALDRINQSILGLPIGLDEAAQRLRRYQMFMGDTEAATNMTIGIQNAIMAGGASEQMKTQAYYQIDRLLSAGKLSTSRQWLSLLQGLGVSTRFLAQEMGDASLTAKEMAAGLTSGEISTEDFLKAVQRLAYNRDITKALDVYKNTYESWISNIGFAFKRGNANVLNALSDSLISSTGVSTLGYMQLFRNGVNAAYTGAVNWLGSNPSVMGGAIGSVQNLTGALGGINFGNLATSIFGNMGRVVDYVATSINRVSGGKLEDFVSFATTLAAPIGGVFKAVSGGLPAMLGVFDRFKNFNFEGLMDKITRNVGGMAGLVSDILSIVPDEAMSSLLAYGLVYGRPIGAALGALGNGARGIGNLVSGFNMGFANLATGDIGRSAFSTWLYKNGIAKPAEFWAWLAPILGTVAIGAGGTLASGGLSYGLYQAYQSAASEAHPYTPPASLGALFGLSSGIGPAALAINNAIEQRGIGAMATEQEVKNLLSENLSDYTRLEGQRNDLVRQWEKASREYEYEVKNLEHLQEITGVGATPEQLGRLQLAEKRVGELRDALYGDNGLTQAVETANNSLSALREEAEKYSNYLTTFQSPEQMSASERAQAMAAFQENTSAWFLENGQTYQDLASQWGGTGMFEPIVKSYFNPSIYGEDSIINQRQSHIDAMDEYTGAIETLNKVIHEGPDDESNRNLAKYFKSLIDQGPQAAAELEGLARLFTDGIPGDPELAYQAAAAYVNELNTELTTGDLMANAAAYAEQVANGQKAMTDAIAAAQEELGKIIHNAEVQETINDLSSGFNKMFNLDAGNLASSLEEATGAANDATSALEDAGAAGEAMGSSVAGGASVAQAAMAAAMADAAAFKSAIEALNGLSAVVTVVTNYVENGTPPPGFSPKSGGTSASNRPGSSNIDVPFSRGGVVYAANGMFIPHGTDTVPAMLTPGEYVVRRKAAAAFGKAFMDRVNALDIHGAFRALSHRMSVPSTGSFIANNQRTYDNHASVTQNIVTNSQSFTHRRARRWVRALT